MTHDDSEVSKSKIIRGVDGTQEAIRSRQGAELAVGGRVWVDDAGASLRRAGQHMTQASAGNTTYHVGKVRQVRATCLGTCRLHRHQLQFATRDRSICQSCR